MKLLMFPNVLSSNSNHSLLLDVFTFRKHLIGRESLNHLHIHRNEYDETSDCMGEFAVVMETFQMQKPRLKLKIMNQRPRN